MTTYITTIILSAYLSNPTLTMAIGTVESGLNTLAVGSMNEQGAFQVRESIWGKVPHTFIAQARHNESIVNTLIKENKGCVNKAIQRYNGSGKQSLIYLAKVKNTALRISLL